MKHLRLLIAVALLVSVPLIEAAAARLQASAPVILYLATSGVDTTANGCSQSNPCQTISFAEEWLIRDWDMRGYPATIDLCTIDNGRVYAEGITITGPLVGQAGMARPPRPPVPPSTTPTPWPIGGADGLTFKGLLGHADICRLEPVTGFYYGVHAADGAKFTVEGVGIKMTGLTEIPGYVGGDGVNVCHGGTRVLLRGIVFYGNLNPWNDVTACFGGVVQFDGSYTIYKPKLTKYASFGAGQLSISVSDCNNVTPQMIASGPGLPTSNVIVTGCSGATATLNNATVASGSSVLVDFISGGNAHIFADNASTVFFNNNGGIDPLTVSVINAGYYTAFVYLYDAGSAQLCATFADSGTAGRRYEVVGNSVLNACGGAATLPGAAAGVTSFGGQVH